MIVVELIKDPAVKDVVKDAYGITDHGYNKHGMYILEFDTLGGAELFLAEILGVEDQEDWIDYINEEYGEG